MDLGFYQDDGFVSGVLVLHSLLLWVRAGRTTCVC